MIRPLKGLYMIPMFALFAFGIAFALLLVAPVLTLIGWLRGPNPRRMETVQRFLFGAWLEAMGWGRMLSIDPPIGRPVEGPSIIVANHPGLFDVLVLIRDIPNMSVMVKRSLSRALSIGPLLRLCGYVLAPAPGRRGTAISSVRETEEQLRKGRRFMLFPEGTRSPKGGLLPFGPGAFRLARRNAVPIQPVVIRNVPPFMPHEDRWYLPDRTRSRFQIEYLAPLPPPERGTEADQARALEARYRELLGLRPAGDSIGESGPRAGGQPPPSPRRRP